MSSRRQPQRKLREPMTDADVEAAIMLNRCRKKLSEPEHKMFVYQLSRRAASHPERGITVAQRWWLWDLVWKYRRLIHDRSGRDDESWACYVRLREQAFQMREASSLRWNVRNLRREAENASVDHENSESYYVASETKGQMRLIE